MGNKTILDLPKEIILLIADFLGPMNTINLKMTCSYFHNIFSDDFFWQHWAKIYLRGKFPPFIPTNPKYPWEASICKYYTELKTWKSNSIFNGINSIRTISLDNVHCASVDAVQLIKDGSICVSGSRDRTLALWDVRDILKGSAIPKAFRINAHRGWIWNIYEANNTVYSASWDQTVNIWDIRETINYVCSINCGRTALSLVLTDYNLLAVGLFNGGVQLYDPRTYRLVESYNVHSKPIFEMVSCENLIYTASQDRKIGVFDIRSLETISHIPMHASLPLSLSVCQNFLYVGDSWGNLHLYDSQNFERKATYSLIGHGRKRQITGIKHNAGSIAISSTDGFIRVYALTDPPRMLMQRSTDGEPISLDRKNDVIVIGKANNSFDILTPKGHVFLQ